MTFSPENLELRDKRGVEKLFAMSMWMLIRNARG
jgi:hypothetical protein